MDVETGVLSDTPALYVPAVTSHLVANTSPFSSRSKRCLDLILALLVIALALPIIAVIYLLVRRDGGPGFAKHTRIGACGVAFKCIKFRTMVVDGDKVRAADLAHDPVRETEWRETKKRRIDPRVTTVGRILRALSLDELPQLFNVVTNDMSLVGPRPITSAEIPRYGGSIRYYYALRPGITGLWQVSGRSNTSYERRVALDVSYAENWSFLNNIRIMVDTVPLVLRRDGVH